jgi:hypothetical protein
MFIALSCSDRYDSVTNKGTVDLNKLRELEKQLEGSTEDQLSALKELQKKRVYNKNLRQKAQDILNGDGPDDLHKEALFYIHHMDKDMEKSPGMVAWLMDFFGFKKRGN